MPWYVSWDPTPPNGWMGSIYSLPHTSSRWTEINNFLSMGAPDSPMRTGHGTVYCSVTATSVDRWIRPLPHFGHLAHRTVRCNLMIVGLADVVGADCGPTVGQACGWHTGQSGAH
jgi:hypothetical protein